MADMVDENNVPVQEGEKRGRKRNSGSRTNEINSTDAKAKLMTQGLINVDETTIYCTPSSIAYSKSINEPPAKKQKKVPAVKGKRGRPKKVSKNNTEVALSVEENIIADDHVDSKADKDVSSIGELDSKTENINSSAEEGIKVPAIKGKRGRPKKVSKHNTEVALSVEENIIADDHVYSKVNKDASSTEELDSKTENINSSAEEDIKVPAIKGKRGRPKKVSKHNTEVALSVEENIIADDHVDSKADQDVSSTEELDSKTENINSSAEEDIMVPAIKGQSGRPKKVSEDKIEVVLAVEDNGIADDHVDSKADKDVSYTEELDSKTENINSSAEEDIMVPAIKGQSGRPKKVSEDKIEVVLAVEDNGIADDHVDSKADKDVSYTEELDSKTENINSSAEEDIMVPAIKGQSGRPKKVSEDKIEVVLAVEDNGIADDHVDSKADKDGSSTEEEIVSKTENKIENGNSSAEEMKKVEQEKESTVESDKPAVSEEKKESSNM